MHTEMAAFIVRLLLVQCVCCWATSFEIRTKVSFDRSPQSASYSDFATASDKASSCSPRSATCRCQPALSSQSIVPGLQSCAVAAADVTVLDRSANMTDSELVAAIAYIISPIEHLRLIPSSLAPLSCLDARAKHEIVGSWGGDVVEMIMALASAESILGKQLDFARISTFTSMYIEKSRAPYIEYHTDILAVAVLQRIVGVEIDVIAVPTVLQEKVIAAFSEPQTHGCHILRQLMQYPSDFAVRKQLVVDVIAAIHTILWEDGHPQRARIRYYVYEAINSHAAPLFHAVHSDPSTCDALASSGTVGHGVFYSSKANPSILSLDEELQMDVVRRQPIAQTSALRGSVRLEIKLPASCQQRRSTAVALSPSLAKVLGMPNLHILPFQPTVVTARRKATAHFIASTFLLDIGQCTEELQALGNSWATKFEELNHMGSEVLRALVQLRLDT